MNLQICILTCAVICADELPRLPGGTACVVWLMRVLSLLLHVP